MNQFNRLELQIKDKLNNLHLATVAIIGCGGVGSFAVETLARSGVGRIIVVDKDVIDVTNINRQIMALHSTVNQPKVLVLQSRIKDINPDCEVIPLHMFYNEDTAHQVYDLKPDFVIDACDTMVYKLHIIKFCLTNKIAFISSMGAANKFDPTKIEITTLDKTYNCKIAKVIRNLVKKEGLKMNQIPVVFSTEVVHAVEHNKAVSEGSTRKQMSFLGSNAFVPSTFGITCASYCFKKIID